jgi:hypothetical protein
MTVIHPYGGPTTPNPYYAGNQVVPYGPQHRNNYIPLHQPFPASHIPPQQSHMPLPPNPGDVVVPTVPYNMPGYPALPPGASYPPPPQQQQAPANGPNFGQQLLQGVVNYGVGLAGNWLMSLLFPQQQAPRT